jgi:type IV secretory pathway component VirB8
MYVIRITCQTSSRFCSYIPYKLKYSEAVAILVVTVTNNGTETQYQIRICDKLKSRHKESKFSKNVFVTYEYNMGLFLKQLLQSHITFKYFEL